MFATSKIKQTWAEKPDKPKAIDSPASWCAPPRRRWAGFKNLTVSSSSDPLRPGASSLLSSLSSPPPEDVAAADTEPLVPPPSPPPAPLVPPPVLRALYWATYGSPPPNMMPTDATAWARTDATPPIPLAGGYCGAWCEVATEPNEIAKAVRAGRSGGSGCCEVADVGGPRYAAVRHLVTWSL